jgi:hypothetical protein
MPSSGKLRRVALLRIDDSEESSASIIRVKRIGELATMLAVTNNPVPTRVTWRNFPDDGILHSHRRENLKSFYGDFFRN